MTLHVASRPGNFKGTYYVWEADKVLSLHAHLARVWLVFHHLTQTSQYRSLNKPQKFHLQVLCSQNSSLLEYSLLTKVSFTFKTQFR